MRKDARGDCRRLEMPYWLFVFDLGRQWLKITRILGHRTDYRSYKGHPMLHLWWTTWLTRTIPRPRSERLLNWELTIRSVSWPPMQEGLQYDKQKEDSRQGSCRLMDKRSLHFRQEAVRPSKCAKTLLAATTEAIRAASRSTELGILNNSETLAVS